MAPRELSDNQLGAIKKGRSLGRTLQKDHPEIDRLFRQNFSLADIVKKLELESKYGVGETIAWDGVRKALSGYDGKYGGEAYEGLIPEEERVYLGKSHRREKALKSGISAVKNKTGIHALTSEETLANAQKGGRKGGIAVTKVRGLELWKDTEIKRAYELSILPENIYDDSHPSNRRGRPNYKLVRNKLVGEGYPDRTVWAVRKRIKEYKKSLLIYT